MIADTFIRWCRRLGGTYKHGKNKYGEDVHWCLTPKVSYVMASVDNTHARIYEDGTTNFFVTETIEIVFDGKSNGYINMRKTSSVKVINPEITVMVPQQKRMYIGSKENLPPWAMIMEE